MEDMCSILQYRMHNGYLAMLVNAVGGGGTSSLAADMS